MKPTEKKWKALLLIAIITLLMISCDKSNENTTDAPAPPAIKLEVDVIVASEDLLNQEEIVAGSITPAQEVAIVSETAQKISRIAFSDGQSVQKGQLLYKLNDSDIKASLKELQAELKLAKLNEQRFKNLLATESIRQQEYDEANTRLNLLRAKEEYLLFQLSKTEIRAPFAGKIGISKVDVGSYVSPGMELANLQDQSTINIEFSVPEKYMPRARKGNKIEFVTQLSDQKHTAVISAVESGLDAQNRSLKVHARAQNPKGELKGGMSAKIYFPVLDSGTKGIEIPSQALIAGEDGYNVFIVRDGLAKIVPVKISNRTESTATVISGLQHGEHLIVSNIMRLGEGMAVQEITTNNSKL